MRISGTKKACLKCKFTAKGTNLCPTCKVWMVDFGKKARCPKKNDKVGWKKLIRLFSYRVYLHNRDYGTCYDHPPELRNGSEFYWYQEG